MAHASQKHPPGGSALPLILSLGICLHIELRVFTIYLKEIGECYSYDEVIAKYGDLILLPHLHLHLLAIYSLYCSIRATRWDQCARSTPLDLPVLFTAYFLEL